MPGRSLYDRTGRGARRRYGKRYRQRRGRQARVRKKYPLVISKVPGTLGLSVKQTLKYCDTIQLVSTINTPATYSYIANDCYDPQSALGGHQPIGFDQMMAFYNHFTVTNARIKVTFVPEGSSATQSNAIVGIELSGNSTPTTAINDIYEQGRSNYRVTTFRNEEAMVVKKSVNLSNFLGQNVLDEDANAGTASGRPAEQVHFHIFVMQMDPAVNQSGNITALVEIEQDVVFHEPKPLVGS